MRRLARARRVGWVPEPLVASDLLLRPPPPADHRIQYGSDTRQFGDLRLPVLAPGQLAPVLVFLHGGWWKAKYDLDYGGHLCAALQTAGIATWSLAYRRFGDVGGGFPGTLEDVAAGYDYLQTLAEEYPLDLARVVASGHSAGGQLAFWLAGRPQLPANSYFAKHSTVPLKAVIGFAGAVDLRMLLNLAGSFTYAHDREEIFNFMGNGPVEEPARYRLANPGDLLPFGLPQVLLQGILDDQIPPALPARWAERSRRQGDSVTVEWLAGASHLDVVDPESLAWPQVLAAVRRVFAEVD